jgi:hypothetical protein
MSSWLGLNGISRSFARIPDATSGMLGNIERNEDHSVDILTGALSKESPLS